MEPARIVAFLQNQWFKNPASARRILERCTTPEERAFYSGAWLFMGCKTGKVLTQAFGDELCEAIVWENASPQIGGESASKFPPDPQHMQSVIEHFKPHLILTFGNQARDGMALLKRQTLTGQLVMGLEWKWTEWQHPESLVLPHPAARTLKREDWMRWKNALETAAAQANLSLPFGRQPWEDQARASRSARMQPTS